VNPYANSPEVMGGYAMHRLVDLDTEAVDHLIARVLRRAHQAAMAVGEPEEARAILDVAQSFADELATALAGFDRLAFVAAVTEDAS
jgi:phosphomevalonate kinase